MSRVRAEVIIEKVVVESIVFLDEFNHYVQNFLIIDYDEFLLVNTGLK